VALTSHQKADEAAFNHAVDEVTRAVTELLDSLRHHRAAAVTEKSKPSKIRARTAASLREYLRCEPKDNVA